MSSMAIFFNDTATTEIYTLSLHDALPICGLRLPAPDLLHQVPPDVRVSAGGGGILQVPARGHHLRVLQQRSEEHTSELQSRQYLVCRLLLEKKNQPLTQTTPTRTVHRRRH